MANDPSQRLILASGSLGRRELMKREGYRFEVMPANVDEPDGRGVTDIRSFVHQVAWMKAAAVAPKIESGLIIAADSVGWIDGQVIGKPADEDDARRILKLLRGRGHELWTGAVIWRRPDGLQVCWQEPSHVHFHALSDAEIESYLTTRLWRGCSGAYAVQEGADPYVHVVTGSVSNVIGLPMGTAKMVLEMLGLPPPTQSPPA
jgi:septum formation protein